MILGAIFSGIMAGVQNKRARKEQAAASANLANAENKMDNLYNATYNTDILDRTDTQSMLKVIRENQQAQNRSSNMYGAVAGLTGESQAAYLNQTGKNVANTFGNIVTNGTNWKNNLYNNYANNKMNFANANMSINKGASEQYRESASQNLLATAKGIGDVEEEFIKAASNE